MKQHWKGIGSYATVGLEFGLSLLVGLLGGQWLDEKLGTGGWLTAVGLGFGLAAGCRAVWRVLRRANREAEEMERQEREARKKFNNELDSDN